MGKHICGGKGGAVTPETSVETTPMDCSILLKHLLHLLKSLLRNAVIRRTQYKGIVSPIAEMALKKGV